MRQAQRRLADRRLFERPQDAWWRRACRAAASAEPVAEWRPNRWLELRGARAHNLQNIDVAHTAEALGVRDRGVRFGQVDTGRGRAVSRALQYQGRPSETAGRVRRAARRGSDRRRRDGRSDRRSAAPHARTRRATSGAFDAIRELFAAEPAAQERKYSAGTFSFNSGNGRCPTCGGNGFEHVEMQFLSDVYLRCPDCDGSRYRSEVLDIKREGADGRRASIADVLEHDGHASVRVFRRCTRGHRAPGAACRGRARVSEARSAGADALGRRGAAAEARRPSGAAAGARQQAEHARSSRQAVLVR